MAISYNPRWNLSPIWYVHENKNARIVAICFPTYIGQVTDAKRIQISIKMVKIGKIIYKLSHSQIGYHIPKCGYVTSLSCPNGDLRIHNFSCILENE